MDNTTYLGYPEYLMYIIHTVISVSQELLEHDPRASRPVEEVEVKVSLVSVDPSSGGILEDEGLCPSAK